jgi:hypothetical protein
MMLRIRVLSVMIWLQQESDDQNHWMMAVKREEMIEEGFLKFLRRNHLQKMFQDLV